jgi:hypothetical protein
LSAGTISLKTPDEAVANENFSKFLTQQLRIFDDIAKSSNHENTPWISTDSVHGDRLVIHIDFDAAVIAFPFLLPMLLSLSCLDSGSEDQPHQS